MWSPDLFSLFLKKACARICLMPGIKSTLKQVFQPVLIPPYLPLEKSLHPFLPGPLPLSLTGFASPDRHTPVLCMGSWVTSRGILRELAEGFVGENSVSVEND